MQPHSAYTAVIALPYDLNRDIWRSRDHDAVRLHWYGCDVAVTPYAFQLRGLWVDRKDLVPTASQLAEHGIGRLARVSGDARHGYASSPKKRCD
jgi:hypothetical protein